MSAAKAADGGTQGAGATRYAEDGMGPALSVPQGADLYLDVTLNGMAAGLAHFVYGDGQMWATAGTLRRLGFILPAGTVGPVRLNDLPGAKTAYTAARQTLSITAPLSLLDLPTTVIGAPRPTGQPAADALPGLLLNYDLYGTRSEGGSATLNAFTEIRAFEGPVVVSSTALSQAVRIDGGAWKDHSVRLDSVLSLSYPSQPLTVRLGDTLTSALTWTRATRIGGIQLARNFDLQPYFVTTPSPALMGSATLPSNVELFVNGIKQYSGSVPAGPFRVDTLPTISGAGNAQIVLTDAFGRATTLDFSLYDTQRLLLRQGLSEWSVELGAVRQNYGLRSFDYGDQPVLSASWRQGITDTTTLETHGEATAGLVNGGIGGAWLLDSAGVVSGSLAGSDHHGERGTQLAAGYEWQNERLHFSLGGSGTRGSYLDAAALYGTPPPSSQGHAVIGYGTERLGSFSLSYLHLHFAGQAATRYASANWFRSLGSNASLILTINQNLVDRRQRNAALFVNWTLDGRTSMGAGVQRDTPGRGNLVSLDASQWASSAGGFGWRAHLQEDGRRNGGAAELSYLGRYGQAAMGIADFADSHYAYADLTGALVLMGGHPFAARHIDQAFAVVSTDGVAGVPVRLENRLIGMTDADGMLLVTPLNAYQNNQLEIDPMTLPADMRVARVRSIATPSDRAGVIVHFPVSLVSSALVTLVDGAGRPLPLGSRVRLNDIAGEPALVGFDGAVYLDTLEEHNRLSVQAPDGAICEARFDYRRQRDGSIAQVGPLPCLQERQ
jgi:outer membrane usher protein